MRYKYRYVIYGGLLIALWTWAWIYIADKHNQHIRNSSDQAKMRVIIEDLQVVLDQNREALKELDLQANEISQIIIVTEQIRSDMEKIINERVLYEEKYQKRLLEKAVQISGSGSLRKVWIIQGLQVTEDAGGRPWAERDLLHSGSSGKN